MSKSEYSKYFTSFESTDLPAIVSDDQKELTDWFKNMTSEKKEDTDYIVEFLKKHSNDNSTRQYQMFTTPYIPSFTNFDLGNQDNSQIQNMINAGRDIIAQKIPYHFGATNIPHEFDCSSFTQYLYKQLGYDIGRTTLDQEKAGSEVEDGLNNVQPGDLIILNSSRSGSGRHVEMVSKIVNGQIYTIAAHGKDKGITEERFSWSPQNIRHIRRIIST